MVLAGRSKLRVSKNFFSGGHLFVFVEYLCKRSPKIKTKNIKNYSSILAIVKHRNWLNDSPPLNASLKSRGESRTQGSRPRPRTQKKNRGQGQGQPFRGQTLLRPRTGMLEAKAKDQGHKCKCSPKSQKFFRRSSKKKKVFTKIF